MAKKWKRHDLVFFALGGLTTVALLASASLLALEVGAVTALYAAVLYGLRGRTGVRFEQAALLLAYAYSLWFYLGVARIVPALGLATLDSTLLRLDEWLLGVTPSVWMQGSPAWLDDGMSVAYFAYLPYLHVVALLELFASPKRADALASRLFPAFALGYAGYLLVPAVGPLVAFPELYASPLSGGWITTANHAFMEAGSPGFDVFPSLHILITLVVWSHDWSHARWRAWLMLPVVLLLAVSTLHLRYHYAVDLLAAVFVFGVVVALTRPEGGAQDGDRPSDDSRDR